MCILKLIARPLFTPRLPRLLYAHFRPPSKVGFTRGSTQRVTRLADNERSTGVNYHFGFRVIESTSTPTSPHPHHAKRLSLHSSREAVDYVIWRRWEDCLDFQRTLEVEYSAVSKRRRKGEPAMNHHAKNMLYPSQRAASFESLPLGPDPSTIPVDVHAHIPRLSKKSTIFRMNEAIIHQRGEEVKAMTEALFNEDAPSTLQELRTVITVRDFFGYWWRDKEADRKTGRTPAFNSATQSTSHQGKGGDLPKQSTVVTPELIAFATGGKIAGRSKLKQSATRRPSQTPSNGSREALHSPSYEHSRPTTPAFAQVVSPHTPFFASAAVTGGGSQKRQPPSYRPSEGAMSFRSPALPNLQSNMPGLDSPGPFSPYTNPHTSPLHGNGFSHPSHQRSLPQNVPTGSHPSHLAQYLPPGGNISTRSAPLMHPMQGRTASMPLQRRRRDGTADQPGLVPRRRNDAIDTSGNRSARIFGAATGVVNSPPPISTSISEGERGTNLNTRHQRDLRWRRSRSQVDLTRASDALPHHIGSQQSYGSDTSITSAVQTLLSSDHSTSITTPQSSQHSSTAVQGHHTVPSWGSRRMSLDSLAPTDLKLSPKDKRRPHVTQSPNPRHSVSSDSSHTDSSDAVPVYPPFASMPSLPHPSKLQPSSASQPTPPRPPRSALRLSSTLSRAASSPANSPLTPAEDGGAAVTADIELSKRARTNDEIIMSYLRMSTSEDPFELEFRPQPPTTTAHHARGTANYVVPPLPPPDPIAPIPASEVSPTSPATPLMGATTTVKAVHEASGTIFIFRVPRMSTSLADLRKKLSRKFMDAENIKIAPEQLELRCLAPASFVPNVANRPTAGGAGYDGGVKSTHGANGLWLPLKTEADWHMAAANPSGKITVKVF